jgi:hypothetical protein
MTIHVDGESQLGANTVGSGNQDRPPETVGGQSEKAAESTQSGDDFRPSRPGDGRFDQFHQSVSGIDVDTGVLVTERRLIRHGSIPSSLLLLYPKVRQLQI